MQHIETVVVPSGGSSSITFMAVGDIPSEYTDLLIVHSVRTTRNLAVDDLYLQVNGQNVDATRYIEANGSSVLSGADPTYANRVGIINAATSTASTFGNGQVYISNYRSAVAKSLSYDAVSENNATLSFQYMAAALETGTSPITSLTIYSGTGNTIVQYSSASLYGIKSGSDGTTVVS